MRRQVLTLRAQFWASLLGTSTEGNSPPKCFKGRTWGVGESDFNLICLQGADPRGLWQPCEQTICLYLFLQTLLENSFILGSLPCITLSLQFPVCPILCLCFFCMACYYKLHSILKLFFIQWHFVHSTT